ncbi:Fungal specific transcription factor domain [Ceratobasidium sp. AG-Ba]|nr:Fungal specific transcription factor domain [Ceratobasidium sp. AG-Ba]QRW07187.1 Fungal specific transcription factor domain [Ceratobasidium sp. AG-Ba]
MVAQPTPSNLSPSSIPETPEDSPTSVEPRTTDGFQNTTFPLDSQHCTKVDSLVPTLLWTNPDASFETHSSLTKENTSNISIPRSCSAHFSDSIPAWNLIPRSSGTSTYKKRLSSAGSSSSEADLAIPSACDSHLNMGFQQDEPCVELEDEANDTEDDEQDTEGIMESIGPTLVLDRSVESNIAPYIISSVLQWAMRSLFEPTKIAYMIGPAIAQRCAESDEFRYINTLIGTVADITSRNANLALSGFPEMTKLESLLNYKLVSLQSGLELQPEIHWNDAFVILCNVYEMMMARRLSSSMAFHTSILDRVASLYLLLSGNTPDTPICLQPLILHSHPVFCDPPAMDILLSLSTCRPMMFDYDTTLDMLESNPIKAGLQWKYGLPDMFMILLARMNMLREKHAPNIAPSVIGDLEAKITYCEPRVNKSSDSCLYVSRLMVHECWRHFMYIYLYMGLCGANSYDVRVERALKRLVKVLDKTKPGRIPDAFLVTPISLAGMAAHKERDRDTIRQRLRGVCEYSQPDTYVNDAAYILETVWATADGENRPAVWSDLRFACFVMTGIV